MESRSIDHIERAAKRTACPIVLVDCGDRIRETLEAIEHAARVAPYGMILVIDRSSADEFAAVARELGASMILPDSFTPPQLVAILERWITIAQARNQSDGWAEDRVPEPDPLENFLAAPDLWPGPL